MIDWYVALLLCFACLFAGNWMGDTKTLIDCATKQSANLLGAGRITCQPAALEQKGDSNASN